MENRPDFDALANDMVREVTICFAHASYAHLASLELAARVDTILEETLGPHLLPLTEAARNANRRLEELTSEVKGANDADRKTVQ